MSSRCFLTTSTQLGALSHASRARVASIVDVCIELIIFTRFCEDDTLGGVGTPDSEFRGLLRRRAAFSPPFPFSALSGTGWPSRPMPPSSWPTAPLSPVVRAGSQAVVAGGGSGDDTGRSGSACDGKGDSWGTKEGELERVRSCTRE